MVWFQCEDCGENLKKPKLPNHFRMCSAFKLSCIDCGETFGQQSVQAHNQCITEAEKYGPKGQGGKPLNSTPAKAKNQSNGKPEVDINVGLSSRAPWYCSLCNTNATSRQTLLLHAEGKKHRSKARAFHASKQPPKPAEEATPNITGSDVNTPMEEPLANNGIPKEEPLGNKDAPKEELLSNTDEELKEENRPKDAVDNESTEENGKKVKKSKKKRELLAASENGEVIQAKKHKKEESTDTVKKAGDFDVDKAGHTKEVGKGKIKLKKLITSVLKADPEGALEKRKLQKLVVKAAKESCPTESTKELKEMCMNKINSSSRFAFDEKGRVCLAEKTKT